MIFAAWTCCFWLALTPPASPPPGADGATGAWDIAIVAEGEEGEPMTVSGAVYGADGETPVAGATVYVYQTDITGEYGRDEQDRPRLRGTMTTDKQGRYRFRTIKPAAYPGSGPPAHIHFEITAPGERKRYFDLWFEGDPRISERLAARHAGKGRFSQIQALTRDEDGALRCTRDFRLD